MPISPPGVVATGQVISSAYSNGIRAALLTTYAELYAHAANVDALGHSYTNSSLVSATTVTATTVTATNVTGSSASSFGGQPVVSGIPVRLHSTDAHALLTHSTATRAASFNFNVSGLNTIQGGLSIQRRTTAGVFEQVLAYLDIQTGYLGINTLAPQAFLHINGLNVSGVEPITVMCLDRVYGSLGDSMDIVFGGGSGMGGNRAGRISCNATATGQKSFIFYAQTASGDGYTNEVARMTPAGLTVSSAWNGPHFIMGIFHFWIDAAAKLRYQTGAPIGDLDGVIIGP